VDKVALLSLLVIIIQGDLPMNYAQGKGRVLVQCLVKRFRHVFAEVLTILSKKAAAVSISFSVKLTFYTVVLQNATNAVAFCVECREFTYQS
jgi:hypothetical protein